MGAFLKGAPLSKADITDEGTPFILYGELYTTYGEVTRSVKRKTDKVVESQFYSKVGDVIMPTSGETPEDIATASCIMIPNVILAGDLLIYRTSQVDGRIVSFAVKNKVNKQISSVAQGKSVVHVRADELSKIAISYPSIEEQQKILSMLELLETKIAKQRELVEHLKKYKRGVVKAVFSGKLELSAEYPFQEWESKAICECLDYEQPQKYIVDSEKYDDSFATPVLTANKGFILGYTDEQQGIYDKGDVIIYDDFTMDMKYVTFNFKVKSSTIKMLTPTKGNDLYFMYSLLQSLELQPEGHQRSYISKVEPMIVRIPPYKLQLKISEFLKNIDNRVALVEKELAFLVAQKQGLMQGLFA